MTDEKDSVRMYCATSVQSGQGGISRVSQLATEVLSTKYGESYSATILINRKGDEATFAEKLTFFAKVESQLLFRSVRWLLFDHLGIATTRSLSLVGRPYGIYLHSTEVWRELSPRKKSVLMNADLLLANSSYTVERARELHPDLPEIVVCHPSLMRGEYVELPRPRTRSELFERMRIAGPYALIVGRIPIEEQHKGHELLIRHWDRVVREVPSAQLVVVGAGSGVPYLERCAKEAGVSASIIFAGRVDSSELAELYSSASMFTLPSRGEGFGMVHLEAMKHGLPCIASEDDGSREIVLDGITGFQVSQSAPEMMVARIVALFRDPALAMKLGRCGFERLQRDFSYARFESTLLGAIEARLESGRAVAPRARSRHKQTARS